VPEKAANPGNQDVELAYAKGNDSVAHDLPVKFGLRERACLTPVGVSSTVALPFGSMDIEPDVVDDAWDHNVKEYNDGRSYLIER
jgi:hypothetical protein